MDIALESLPGYSATGKKIFGVVDGVLKAGGTLSQLDVTDFGAKGDGKKAIGGMTAGSGVLTLTTARFAAGDVGKQIMIDGAGAGGAFLPSTILSYQSPTQVTLAVSAGTDVSGKIVHWGTDDTAALQAAVTAADALGVARVYIPAGIYIFSRLTLPAREPSQVEMAAITIEGVAQPSTLFGTLATNVLSDKGTILKSFAIGGAAIAAAPSTQYGGISLHNTTLRNFEIRTHDNPNITAIDMANSCQMSAENLHINTGIYSFLCNEPTHSNAAGLITPRIDNGALTFLRNICVSGYYDGIQVNEHTEGHCIGVHSNRHGLRFLHGVHNSYFSRVCAQQNKYALVVQDYHKFKIDMLNIEHLVGGYSNAQNSWMLPVADVYDSENVGIGEITYSVWQTGGGAGAFLKTGGGGIITNFIGAGTAGAPMAAYLTSNKTIGNNAVVLVTWDAGLPGPDAVFGADQSRLKVLTSGYYELSASIAFAAGGGQRAIFVKQSSGTQIGLETYPSVVEGVLAKNVTFRFNLDAGNEIQVFLFQNTGAPLDVLNADYYASSVSLRRISAKIG